MLMWTWVVWLVQPMLSGASWWPVFCDKSISGCDGGKDLQQVFLLICKGSANALAFISFLSRFICYTILSYPYFSLWPLSFHSHFLYLFLSFTSTLQGVVVAEKTRGGQLLEEPKMLPFRANTFSLQVSIQDVPQFLWSIKPFTTCQVTMETAITTARYYIPTWIWY